MVFIYNIHDFTFAEFDKDGYHLKETYSGRTGHEADWEKLAQDELKANIYNKLPKIETARNLILMIGDFYDNIYV